MPVIYIPVDVDESLVAEIVRAQMVAGLLGAHEISVTQPVPPTEMIRVPSEFGYQVTQAQPQPADPWASPAMQAPSGAVAQTPVSTPQAGAVQSTSQGAPRCIHGEMRYVAAGQSKKSGQWYAAFYGCAAPQGVQQCRSVKA
jgi:hypothetical protein